MALKFIPTDDHILLEAPEEADKVNGIYRPGMKVADDKVRAKVIAVGPGELNPQGTRNPMPCKVGDTVLVGAGAGFTHKQDGKSFWFVYGGRKDIIAVVEELPTLVAA